MCKKTIFYFFLISGVVFLSATFVFATTTSTLSPNIQLDKDSVGRVFTASSKFLQQLQENPITPLLRQPSLKNFIIDTLKLRYSSWGLPESLAKDIVTILIENSGDPEQAVRKTYQNIIDFGIDQSWNQAYQRYKEETKYTTTYDQISPHIRDLPEQAVVLDLGAGNNAFGKTMGKLFPKVHFVGVDVIDYSEESNLENLKFIQQPSSTIIPVEDKSVDIITVNAVLHHVEEALLPELISEIKRVLKSGGKVILIEDTYSTTIPFHNDASSEITTTFLNLIKQYGSQFAKDYFTFNDWYANIVVHKWIGMALPYNFKSIEEWQNYFEERGFSLENAEHFGFPQRTFHKPDIGVLVFTQDSLDANIVANLNPLPRLTKENVLQQRLIDLAI